MVILNTREHLSPSTGPDFVCVKRPGESWLASSSWFSLKEPLDYDIKWICKQLSSMYPLEKSKMLMKGNSRQTSTAEDTTVSKHFQMETVSRSALRSSHFEELLGRKLRRKVPQNPWPAFPP